MKGSDRHAYLNRKSEHPVSLKRSIPFAQALRLRRICSTNNEFQGSCDNLHNKLIERGYKEQEINEVIERTKTDKSCSKRKQRNEVLEYHLY